MSESQIGTGNISVLKSGLDDLPGSDSEVGKDLLQKNNNNFTAEVLKPTCACISL